MNTRHLIYLIGSIAIITCLIIGSCSTPIDPDIPTTQDEVPPIPQGPSLEFRDTINFLSEQRATVRPGSTFSLILDAKRGDSLLVSLEITLNGQPLPTSDYTINGETPPGSFFILSGEDQNQFSWQLEVTAPSEETRVIYEFELIAEDNRTDAVAITIDTELNDFSPPNIELLTQEEPTVVIGDTAFFDLRVDALGSPIESISVFTGAFLTETSRLTFGGEQFTDNPMILNQDDRQFFEKSIGFEVPISGEFRNTIILTDSLGSVHTLEVSYLGVLSIINLDLLTTEEQSASVGDMVFFDIRAEAFGSLLDSIFVSSADTLVSMDSLTLDNELFTSNPMSLVGVDAISFEKQLGIIVKEAGINRNTIMVTDTFGFNKRLQVSYEGN